MGKYCYNCGTELRDGAKFCHNCGAKQDRGTSDVSTAISGAISSVASSAGKVSRAVASSVKNQVEQPGSAVASSSPTLPLVAVDFGLFAAVTFFPWVSSYYAEAGSGLSLPGLAREGIHYISTISQYSSYAYQYGADELYKNAIGILVLISLAAGIGWFCSLVRLYYDAKHDLKGERSSGSGSMTVAILAASVQVLVWIGVAYLKSSLANEYFDISYALNGVIETTMWVWLSFAGGIAGYFMRQSIYQNLGWVEVKTAPSQNGQAN